MGKLLYFSVLSSNGGFTKRFNAVALESRVEFIGTVISSVENSGACNLTLVVTIKYPGP